MRLPYIVVLDEVDAITEDLGSVTVLHHGPVCVPGVSCEGVAVEVRSSFGSVHSAWVSVYNFETSGYNQRFYGVSESGGSWDIALDPDNVDVPWTGILHRRIGIDYDLADDHFGVFQSSQQVHSLSSATSICSIPGHPLDFVAWGPNAIGTEHDSYHLVLYEDTIGDRQVVIYPASGCPDTAPEAVTVAVGDGAVALDISRRAETSFFAYTADEWGLTQLDVTISTTNGQDNVIISSTTIDQGSGSRPTALAFRRDEPPAGCVPGKTDEFCPDIDDPHCIAPPVDAPPTRRPHSHD